MIAMLSSFDLMNLNNQNPQAKKMKPFYKISSSLQDRFTGKASSDANSFLQLILHSGCISAHFFGYLTLKDISNFDVACLNHSFRASWLSSPKHLGNEQITLSDNEQIKYCIQRNLHISILAIMNENQTISDSEFQKFIKQCRFLTKFRFEHNNSIKADTFKQFIRSLKFLQTLCIDSCACINNETLSLVGQNCKQLETFSMFSCPETTIVGLESMTEGCNKLRVFFIKNGHDVERDTGSLFPTLGKNCPLLMNICLKGYNINSTDFDLFTSKCKYMQSIGLYTCHGLNDTIFKAFGKNSKFLERFCYGETDGSKIYEVTSVGLNAFLKGCNRMKVMTTDAMFPNVSDQGFTKIGQYCPLLERFRFDCSPLTDVTLNEFGRLTRLRRVYFFTENEFTDDGILSLLNGGIVPDMASVIEEEDLSLLTQSPRIDTNDMSTKQQKSPRSPRASLALSKCTNNTVASKPLFHPLETFSLRVDGLNTTDVSIYHIANYCPNLRDIYIVDENRTVQQESIDYLLSKAKKLAAIHGNGTNFNRDRNENSIVAFLLSLSKAEIMIAILLLLAIILEVVIVYRSLYR